MTTTIADPHLDVELDAIARSTDLHALTEIVRRGKRTAWEVIAALARIRDAKLYKATHSSWESWLQDHWWGSKRHVDRQIVALRVFREMGHSVPTAPETHARELARVPAEQRGEVLAEAGPQATAGDIREVVERRAAAVMSKEQLDALVQTLPADVVIARAKELRRQGTRESFHSSESVQWYSPSGPVESARELMGGIDLDPASSPEANLVIKADRIFTAGVDGLAQTWDGRVWLNWPGGRNEEDESNADLWSTKLMAEHAAGRATEAVVMLFNAATDRGWFQRFWDYPLCFVKGRFKFRRPGGETGNQPLQPNALAYLGPQTERFAELFAKYGRIVLPRGRVSEAL